MTPRYVVLLGVAVGVLSACAPSTLPPAPPPSYGAVPTWSATEPPAPKNQLAIVVSGGVSLGAYQGGYLYALSEELKREHVRPALYVGASAGTINALLLGVEMCHPSVPDPDASPLRSVWMRASLAQLRNGSTTTSPTAVFPQDGVRAIADTIRTRLSDGMAPGCDFVVSGETSRIHPRAVKVDENETVPDIQEPFTVRITVGADGRPQIHNYVTDDGDSPAQALLPFPVNQDVDRQTAVDLLIDLVLASSAFPGAFPQVDLPHCMTDPTRRGLRTGGPTECGALPIHRHTPFADGGVLDNTPIGLAIETARRGWAPDEKHWSEPKTPDQKTTRPRGISYLLVDTDNDVYDPLPTGRQALHSILTFAEAFGGAFLDAARGRALYDTLQQFPELHAHLAVSELHVRLASRYLFAFFGFFDTRLRDFDFVGGMYDAARFVAGGRLADLLEGESPSPDALRSRDEAGAKSLAGLQAPTGPWRELACLAQAYDPTASSAHDQCTALPEDRPTSAPWERLDGPNALSDLTSFVQLTQASLDVLYSQCECAENAAPSEHRQVGPACTAIAPAGATPPLLRPTFTRGPGWKQGCNVPAGGAGAEIAVEDPFEYAARRLAQYGFAGASLGQTMDVVRARVGALTDEVVARQPSFERVVEGVASPVAVDAAFGYRPALHSAYAGGGVGGAETGYSFGRWMRIATALQLKGWRNDQVAVTPLVGVDWNLPFTCAAAQVHAFARVGFQFGNVVADDVLSPCWNGFGGRASRCIVGQAGLAVTLLELLRLQGAWEESDAPFGKALNHLLIELGLQANWPAGGD